MTKPVTTTWLVASALVLSAVGVFIWKKRRSYVKVGKISKLFFFPVKSLKAVEVKSGKCTKLGLEVNGVLDRSFMLVTSDGLLISQRDAPSMVFLVPRINGKTLIVSTPSGEELKVEIRDCLLPEDKIINCRPIAVYKVKDPKFQNNKSVFRDVIEAVDCGDEAANFFQSFLKLPSVRLVRFCPSLPLRTSKSSNSFETQARKAYPVAFPDFAPFHVLSQASIDDLNTKLDEEQISVLNFRPNILAEDCNAYAEDAWRYVKFPSGAELNNFMMTARCLLTTNNPSTGVCSKKEPLVTLRKYRIPKDPEIIKKTGSIPCFGINCGVLKPGEISVGDDIYADVGRQPEMNVK